MVQRNDRWLDLHLTRDSLAVAKFLGKAHLDNMRLMSSLKYPISDSDLRRILAYNEIRDLKKTDITIENVDSMREAMEWAQWVPKEEYPARKDQSRYNTKDFYIYDRCGRDMPAYTATFPDGSKVDSLMRHRNDCLIN